MAHPIPLTQLAMLATGGVVICGAVSAMAHKAYVELDKTRRYSPFVDRMAAMTGVLMMSVAAAGAGWFVADDVPHVGARLGAVACGIGGLLAPALYGGVVAAARKFVGRMSPPS